MGAHHGTVEDHVFHVWVIDKMLMQILPDAVVAPTRKALVDTVPCPVFVGQQAPLRPAARHPQHTFNEAPAVVFRSRICPWMLSEEGIDLHPLILSDKFTCHPPIIPQMSTLPNFLKQLAYL